MKKIVFTLLLIASVRYADAQIPGLGLVTGLVKKVIIALDLKVQRLQNETIALQNAAASLENNLHLNSLTDINDWLNKEKGLYQQYYQELATVRQVIAGYDEVKRIIRQQKQLLTEYNNAIKLFKQDRHFSAAELDQMSRVYSGIVEESARHLQDVVTAVTALATQMKDAERLSLIHRATQGMQRVLNDLRQFNRNNMQLSLARSKDEQDRRQVRDLYGLN